MRRTTLNRRRSPIKISESRLRRIIKNVIRENAGPAGSVKSMLQSLDGTIVDPLDVCSEILETCGSSSSGASASVYDILEVYGCFSDDLRDSRASGRNFEKFMSTSDGVYFVCPSEPDLSKVASLIERMCGR